MAKFFYEDEYCKYSIDGTVDEIIDIIRFKKGNSINSCCPQKECNYYYLSCNDIIKHGDEFLDINNKWNPVVNGVEVGSRAGVFINKFRRPIL